MDINFSGEIAKKIAKNAIRKLSCLIIYSITALNSACTSQKSEVYEIFSNIKINENTLNFNHVATTLEEKNFTINYRPELNEIVIYKYSIFDFKTSNPIIILTVKNGLIVGKGIRMFEGNYSICDAPPDVGETEKTIALPDGRPCL